MEHPCLYCNPSKDALTWCTTCIARMEDEHKALCAYCKDWKHYAYAFMSNGKIIQWITVYAPSRKTANTYMRTNWQRATYTAMPGYPAHDPHVMGARCPIPDSAWRQND